MFGIDVSEHNGNINWDLVKPHIGFAVLRLGWIGRAGVHKLDARFQRNYAECRRLGIPIGVYVYCYSGEPAGALAGAEWTLENLSGKSLELPVFIDMEEQSIASQGRRTLTQISVAFCERIRQGGFTPGVYANLNWYNNYLEKETLKSRYFTWIAAYSGGTDRFKGEYDMWQNSDTGRVNGISGPVDTDFLYAAFPGVSGGQDVPQPEPSGEGDDPYAGGQDVPQPERRVYVVRPGDTLSAIALRFGTTVEALVEKNGIANPDLIYASQELIV